MYDLKYHPMDESIRPTQAAKRRSVHGEAPLFSDDSNQSFSVHGDSSTDSDVDQKEDEPKPTRKGKKRTRQQSRSLEPTRRSSRRTSDAKVLYDMNVHPQDDDLIVLSSDDEDDDDKASKPIAKRKKVSHSSTAKFQSRTKGLDVTEVSSDMDLDEPMSSVESSNDGMKSAPVEVPGMHSVKRFNSVPSQLVADCMIRRCRQYVLAAVVVCRHATTTWNPSQRRTRCVVATARSAILSSRPSILANHTGLNFQDTRR